MLMLGHDYIPLDISFATLVLRWQKLKSILYAILENFVKDINVLSKTRNLAIYVFCFLVIIFSILYAIGVIYCY